MIRIQSMLLGGNDNGGAKKWQPSIGCHSLVSEKKLSFFSWIFCTISKPTAHRRRCQSQCSPTPIYASRAALKSVWLACWTCCSIDAACLRHPSWCFSKSGLCVSWFLWATYIVRERYYLYCLSCHFSINRLARNLTSGRSIHCLRKRKNNKKMNK